MTIGQLDFEFCIAHNFNDDALDLNRINFTQKLLLPADKSTITNILQHIKYFVKHIFTNFVK